MVKDSPLSEITLRKYEKPYNLSRREIIKKICLSIGILQPGDSRDIIVDILLALLDAAKDKRELVTDEIKNAVIETRKANNLEMKGIADSNIRRQLKRLRDMMIVEKSANNYRITEFESLQGIFESKIEKFMLPQIIERIKEYISESER